MPSRSVGFIRGRVWGAVASACTILTLIAAPVPAAEDCAACHGEIVERFQSLPHGRAFKFDKAHGTASCESCHGPGEAHAEGGDVSKIVHPGKAESREGNDACLSCHENQNVHAFWRGSEHEAAGLRCAHCHTVHAVQPARRDGMTRSAATERCLSCHAAQRKGLGQRSRHPLNEGKMDCVSCHNPHGTASEKMVKGDSINDLCYSCHEEKRGPFLWEHAPVRESCATCHTPHGSNHDKMLVSRTTQLCQSCHLQGRHQTVAGVPEAIWNQNRMCLNCHPQIHGSNHLSGPLFQR
jgi:DmsE family decaheme c-type cytochrome